jgi:hypothetical protein
VVKSFDQEISFAAEEFMPLQTESEGNIQKDLVKELGQESDLVAGNLLELSQGQQQCGSGGADIHLRIQSDTAGNDEEDRSTDVLKSFDQEISFVAGEVLPFLTESKRLRSAPDPI